MLFGLANSLRSLTRSPIAGALHEARRMARRPLETGGAASAQIDADAQEFVLPTDVDPVEVVGEIGDKLRSKRQWQVGNAAPVLEAKADGRIVVSADLVMQLGGRRVVDQIISAIRAHRVLRRMRYRQRTGLT